MSTLLMFGDLVGVKVIEDKEFSTIVAALVRDRGCGSCVVENGAYIVDVLKSELGGIYRRRIFREKMG